MAEQINSFREAATHPIAAASYAFTLVVAVFNIPALDAVGGVLWNQAGILFGATSVTATQLAPQIDWLPMAELQVVALITGGLFVVTRLYRLWTALNDRLEETNS